MKVSVKPQPRRREKPDRGKRFSRPVRYLIILLCLFLPTAFGYVWLRVRIIQISYDIAAEQKQKLALMEINKKLRIQLSNLKSPERIEKIALTQLGLRPPQKGQIEILR
jgi:cell division protein FtsL